MSRLIVLVLLCSPEGGVLALRSDDRQKNLTQDSPDPLWEDPLSWGHPQVEKTQSHQASAVGARAQARIHVEQVDSEKPSAKEILLAVGGGTGAGAGTGKPEMDRDIIRRMRYQDKLVLGLMVAAYFIALLFTASLAYRQATNNSPVRFYADPRVEALMIDSSDLDDFIWTFIQPPKTVQLCVQGLMPLPALLAHLAENVVEWQGGYYRHIFSFSLDLTPFLVHAEPQDRSTTSAESDSVAGGISEDEIKLLRRFLQENTNELATVKLMKEVHWDCWEELATNIKQKIRQRGFEGLIHVCWTNTETLTVYQNNSWANFLHMSVTRVLNEDFPPGFDDFARLSQIQVAVALRVGAYAEELGAPQDWIPWRFWTLDTFAASPGGSRAAAVQRFDALRQRVQCLFASKALLWGNDWAEAEEALGCEVTSEALLVANVQRALPRFLRFCSEVKHGAALDDFVFEIRGREYCADLTSFARTVRLLLAMLSAGDPSGARCFARKVAGRGWYFQFAREPIFVTSFAPCYGAENPRYQFNQHPESCFILFQPEESFLRHDLPPDKPRRETNWDHPVDIRDRIRSNFRRHGREYRIPETTQYPPAEFIVAPLEALNDPPVRFWES